MADKPHKSSNYLGSSIIDEPDRLHNYIQNIDRDIKGIVEFLSQTPYFYSQDAEPDVGKNSYAFWNDTDGGPAYYLVANFNGTQVKVALT